MIASLVFGPAATSLVSGRSSANVSGKWTSSDSQGRNQTFSFGGATGGASFATRGAVNGLVGLSERDLKNFGGARQNFGAVAPLAPPCRQL